MEKELCVRCGKEAPYDQSITYYDATLVCRGSGAGVDKNAGGNYMIQRIKEIRKCLNANLYEAALALALTLPDICGQIEYPNALVGKRYTDWISNFVDKELLCDRLFENDFEYLTSADLYKLRCSFLHSGNDDLQTKHIDEFRLLSPSITNGQYGYRYGTRPNQDGTETHIAEIDIKYLCEMLCDEAEKYYESRNTEDFVEHTFVLQT